ncbi:MAG: 6-phosphogluconolactonase [Pikeienuella sp.]|uniref:6-phosphogluconolactonase n=1 Tax=Pikeienuella sp. TaxID=2831957 RepID=UPI00391A1776
MIPFHAHESGAALAAALAREAAETLRAAIVARGRALFAAPGGSTPAAFLAALAAAPLDWARVTILPGDERWVPPEDDRSNEGMIRRAMPGARILPFWRAGEGPEAAAPRLSAELAPLLPLDLAVIGMGEDMHCASLFPGAGALPAALAADAPPVMAIRAPGAPEPRLTLTLPPLAGAGRLVLLIRGEAKREALALATETEDPLAAPVSAVLRAARAAEVRWAP